MNRQPRGIPTGGEFAKNEHGEAPSILSERRISGHTVTPGVWDDRARALYDSRTGPQRLALATALSHRFGGGGKIAVRLGSDGYTAERIVAETEDGFVVDADGWHNRIDALGIEYPYNPADMEPYPSDDLPWEDHEGQDVELARSFLHHFEQDQPEADPEPWFGNWERDRRYETAYDARVTGDGGTVYDPRPRGA